MSNRTNIPVPRDSLWTRLTSLVRGRFTPLFYGGSSLATEAAQLVAGFLVIKWITPQDLGLWQSLRLAQVYAFILLAGVNNGLGRELPFYLGKGEDGFAHRLADTALFCVTVASAIVLIIGVICGIAFAGHGGQLVWAILALAIIIALAFYQHIFTLTFRSNDSFKSLSHIQFIEAGLSLATVPMVYFFGFNGMIGRTLAVAVVKCFLLFYLCPMSMKIRVDWAALKLLLKTGLPIFGLDYVKNSCGTLDRVVLLRLGGVNEVGIYALAGVAIQTLGALPAALGTYIYPRMTYKFGQTGDGRTLWRMGFKCALMTVGYTALAGGCAWLVLPHFVPVFAPKYMAGLRAAEIVLLAQAIEAATVIVNALWSMKAWRLMVAYQVLSAILFALGPILGVIFISRSVEGVAWGAVIGAVGRGILALGLTFRGTRVFNPPQPSSPVTGEEIADEKLRIPA